jgi:malonyl CoA-acyl carrier protein transacylase
MKTYMFPGQGAQFRGMGGSLFDEYEELTNIASEVLGYSIKDLCLEDPRKELNLTQFTQPALYVVNALTYLRRLDATRTKPDYFIGHSLGEFNALLAAECFDFATGLKLVQKRGELMSQAKDGAMAAILNSSKEQIETILRENHLSGIDLANFNTPTQIVISGLKADIAKAQNYFQTGSMLYVPLNTGGAFHSRYMQAAREKFTAFLQDFQFAELTKPVIANITAAPYPEDAVASYLTGQITSSVKWCESVQYLMRLGNMEFEEIGQGDVLTKMVLDIKRKTPDLNSVPSTHLAPNQPTADRRNEAAMPGRTAAATSADAATRPEDKVAAWNSRHPIGTRVKSTIVNNDILETRTQALVLFGHRAAVYMKGYNGYFDLDEVVAV